MFSFNMLMLSTRLVSNVFSIVRTWRLLSWPDKSIQTFSNGSPGKYPAIVCNS